jgi:hypothetical protein
MRTSIEFVALLLVAVAQLASARVRGSKSVSAEHQAFHRRLTKLVGYGAEPDAHHFPLQLCEGDCDCDHQCDEGLVCFQRDAGYGPIPSCADGENFDADTDFCVPSSSPRTPAQMPTCPTDRPAPAPTAPKPTIVEPAVQAPEPTQEGTSESTSEATDAATDAATTAASAIGENTENLPPLVFIGDEDAVEGRPLGLCSGKHSHLRVVFFRGSMAAQATNKQPV